MNRAIVLAIANSTGTHKVLTNQKWSNVGNWLHSRAIFLFVACFSSTAATMANPSYAQEGQGDPSARESNVVCPDGKELDPYQVWAEVDSTKEAEDFLVAAYQKFASYREFAVWLRCQGFRVSVHEGPIGSSLGAGEVHIGLGFLIASLNRPPLWNAGGWFDALKGAHTFEIFIDRDGRITRVIAGMTSK